jgi:hypothetical protein
VNRDQLILDEQIKHNSKRKQPPPLLPEGGVSLTEGRIWISEDFSPGTYKTFSRWARSFL